MASEVDIDPDTLKEAHNVMHSENELQEPSTSN